MPGPVHHRHPDHLTPSLGSFGQSRPHQRLTADARLALDQYRAALPPGHFLHAPWDRGVAVSVGGQLARQG